MVLAILVGVLAILEVVVEVVVVVVVLTVLVVAAYCRFPYLRRPFSRRRTVEVVMHHAPHGIRWGHGRLHGEGHRGRGPSPPRAAQGSPIPSRGLRGTGALGPSTTCCKSQT